MTTSVTQGEVFFRAGKIDQARDYFLDQLKSDPNNKEALNNLGVIYFNEAVLDIAAEYFRKSIESDPSYLDAIINLSGLCKSSETPEALREYLNRAISVYPANQEIKALLKEMAVPAQESSISGVPEVSPASATETLRVLHGTYEIANQSRTMAQAIKKAGQFAKTVCYYPNYLKYKSDYTMDLAQFKSGPEAVAGSRAFAAKLIPEFDIFHFHFGTTLALDFSDLPMIQEADKKMTMQYWGSEVRLLSVALKHNPWVKVKNVSEETIRKNLTMMSKYVKQCIVSDYELYEYVKDYFEQTHVIPAVIDLDEYKPNKNQDPNDKIMIVHAPTDTDIKGSAYIQKAIEELKTDYDIDYRMIRGMLHDEAKEFYAQADLIVDQLHVGCYGLLSVECMAMAKPVITWITDFMKDKYPKELPIISANPDTVKEKIRYALDNREMLTELGEQGRNYVEKYHDMNVVIKQMLELYRTL